MAETQSLARTAPSRHEHLGASGAPQELYNYFGITAELVADVAWKD
jgi:hypothetical protein